MKYLYDIIKDMKRVPKANEVGDVQGTMYARKELLWLNQLAKWVHEQHADEEVVKDSWAWYIKQLSLWYLNAGNPQSVEYLRAHNITTPVEVVRAPFDTVYGLVQSGEVPEQRGFNVLRCILGTRAIYLDLTYEEWCIILRMPHLKKEALQSAMLWFATNGQYCAVIPRDIGMFHPTFLRKRFDASKVFNLARDTTAGIHQITSMNMLQQMHDQQAAERRERVRKEESMLYKYTPEFRAACEQGGWHLPAGSFELVERGEDHHNCVASYARRHAENIKQGIPLRGVIARILLSSEATVEMRIYVNDGKITEVECIQCKGKYNKDMDWAARGLINDAIMALDPRDLQVETVQPEEGDTVVVQEGRLYQHAVDV
jgi:hypothetical protein